MSKAELLAAIDRDQASHMSFLQLLIRARSPTPPGDTTDAACVVQAYLGARGIDCDIIAPRERMPNVVSDFSGLAGPGPRLVLNGHLDTCPVGENNIWRRDPWSGEVDGRRIHGRGAADMKAGTAASIIAFSYLSMFRQHLRGSLALMAVCDEEAGGRYGSKWLLDNCNDRWLGDCMINAEPTGLQTIRFGEKGTLHLMFTIAATGGHGAFRHLGEGANRIAARLINRLNELEDLPNTGLAESTQAHLQRPEVRDTLDESIGQGAADFTVRPTLNIGTIHGGSRVNMIPDLCFIEGDIRVPIGMTVDFMMKNVNRIVADFPGVSVNILEGRSHPPNFCAEDHPMVRIIQKNAQQIMGRVPVAIPSLGATDCKFWRWRGVPAYVYGPSPFGVAAANESVSIDEFFTVIKTHAASAWDYLGGPP